MKRYWTCDLVDDETGEAIADQLIVVLASDYDTLAARLTEAEPDALRYRWLMKFYGDAIRTMLGGDAMADMVEVRG